MMRTERKAQTDRPLLYPGRRKNARGSAAFFSGRTRQKHGTAAGCRRRKKPELSAVRFSMILISSKKGKRGFLSEKAWQRTSWGEKVRLYR